jgi:transcriptional regulator with XRE-family HTH domain
MKAEKEKYAERFADYMIESMARTQKRQAEIARLTGLSRTTISQIVGKKPNSTTGKLILPERETVDKIAKAFGDSLSKARRAAGYSDEDSAGMKQESDEASERKAEIARTAELIENWTEMSPEEQEAALAFLKFIKAEHPEALKVLGPKFKVMTSDEIDQDQTHIKKSKDIKSK